MLAVFVSAHHTYVHICVLFVSYRQFYNTSESPAYGLTYMWDVEATKPVTTVPDYVSTFRRGKVPWYVWDVRTFSSLVCGNWNGILLMGTFGNKAWYFWWEPRTFSSCNKTRHFLRNSGTFSSPVCGNKTGYLWRDVWTFFKPEKSFDWAAARAAAFEASLLPQTFIAFFFLFSPKHPWPGAVLDVASMCWTCVNVFCLECDVFFCNLQGHFGLFFPHKKGIFYCVVFQSVLYLSWQSVLCAQQHQKRSMKRKIKTFHCQH